MAGIALLAVASGPATAGGGAKYATVNRACFSPDFTAITGAGCTNNSMVECEYKKFDWAEGRNDGVAVTRGGKNGQGWLWSVSVTDLEVKDTTQARSTLAARIKRGTAMLPVQ